MIPRIVRMGALIALLSLLTFACGMIPSHFEIETTSELGPDTLRRIDALNDTLATGMEIGPETRATIEELNETIRDGLRFGFTEDSLARVDRLLDLVEQGVGIEVGLDPETNATVNHLIDTIDDAPGQWEETATTIIETLEGSTSNVAAQMADEIRDLMTEARLNSQYVTAAVGTEFRCNVDFLGARAGDTVDQFIGRTIVGRLRGIVSGEPEEPPVPVPWVCQIIPDQVDLISIGERMVFETAVVKISGYNYVPDNAPAAYIVDEAGSRLEAVALYPYLSSPYQIQLNLQDIDFSAIPSRSRVVFEWPTAGTSYALAVVFPGEEITPTAVVQAELTITAASVDVRMGPAANYKWLGRAEVGARYVVTGSNGDRSWWQIEYEGGTGWVPASAGTRNEIAAPVVSIPLPPPTADFEMEPPGGDAPLEVQFIDRSTGASELHWKWEFGEGLPVYDQNPSRTFATAGTYTVTLTVENDEGFDSVTRSIVVEEPEVGFQLPGILIPGLLVLPTPTPDFPGGSFLFVAHSALGDDIEYDTRIPSSTYDCGVVSMAAMDGDIYEGGTVDIVHARMTTQGATWWIEADFATHEDDENWSVGVMCLNRAYADRYEFRTERVDIPAEGDTMELPGIPADRFCGVVGIWTSHGDVNEGASSDDILNAFVHRNPSTGIWELTANFRTHGAEEIWFVNVLCLYDNPTILLHRQFTNQMGGRAISTGVSSLDYACGIVGMATISGDINENGAGDILQVYTYIGADQNWYVMPDFRTHISEEFWDIDLLCVRRSAAELQGNWNQGWVH